MNYWLYMQDPMVSAVLSFFIGFGLAAIFRPVCTGSDCIVINGPPVRDVVNKVYQMGAKCVEFTTEVTECPKEGVVKTVEMVAS
jgi:hypothetical protein